MVVHYEVTLVHLIKELVEGHHFLLFADPFRMERNPYLEVPVIEGSSKGPIPAFFLLQDLEHSAIEESLFERGNQFDCDVKACHTEEVPPFFDFLVLVDRVLTLLKHLKNPWVVPVGESHQLGQAQDSSSPEIGGGISSLEADLLPLPGDSS